MFELKGETLVMESDDLDDIVQGFPGKEDFNSVATYEWNNNSARIITDIKDYEYSEDKIKEFNEWRKGYRHSVWYDRLIRGLMHIGLIDNKYNNVIIRVYW